ncbi:MAG TPA: hypothetical protein EYH07_03000 [Kiloniellaceae bacterium]|nr:hypothetical protein [Kiloniellaceae bacterium]
MAGAAVSILLYFAWAVSWHQVFIDHCPMGDAQPLKTAILLSIIPYAVGFMLLASVRMEKLGVVLSVPLIPMMAWQALWGFRLFYVVNVDGLSACTLTIGMPFGSASDDWLEQIAGTYYILVSMGSILGLFHAYRRLRRHKAGGNAVAEVFD